MLNNKKISLLFVLILLFSALSANKVERIYNDLQNLAIDDNNVAVVNNFILRKDVAEFNLQEGKIILLSPIAERTVAAVFIGTGNASINPPTKVSKQSLFAEIRAEQFEKTFDFLFLLFNSTTLNLLQEKLEFSNDEIKLDISSKINDCLKYFYNKRADNELEPALLRAILNEEAPDYFYVHIGDEANWDRPYFFEYDLTKIEEVVLYKRTKRNTVADNFKKVVCSFNCAKDLELGVDLSSENKDTILVDRYIIDANISNRLDFTANCTLEITGLSSSGKWLQLDFMPKLIVDKVKSAEGESLNFLKKENGSDLWIELPEKNTFVKQQKISIDYHGDLIFQGGSVVKMRSYNYWYPQYSTYKLKQFDLTFHYPKTYDLISIGNMVFEEQDDKTITTKWQTDYPVNFATFNMGKFDHEKYQTQDLPTLNLYLDKNLENAKADVANSMNFYQRIFGKCIYDTLKVVEIPLIMSGQAFPGLINFYSDDFLNDAIYKVFTDINITESNFAQLRAHEVAHQWWGCGVEIRSDHDKWLFEGLAEFSSIWFLQNTEQENYKYFDILEKWRNTIIDYHYLKREKGKKDAPVWLGTRAPYYINYGKGAWIFHMLRNLMIDLKTFHEDEFEAMMKDFYATYKNKSASTKDFQLIVEKHSKMNMDWFFEQWIYGNDIPKFDYEYDIKKKEDGNFYAICKITQENVDENFKSYIPFEIDFGKKRFVRRRTLVEGREKEFEIKLPMKAKKITFNIFDSVLSE